MFPFEIKIYTPSDMEKLGGDISLYLLKNYNASIILLEGELGAGKTVFCRGLGHHLGIDEMINSPTYNLLNIYNGRIGRLYHYDLFRIKSPEGLVETGFIELWSEKSDMPTIHAVEWWKKAGNLIPDTFPKFLIQIFLSEEFEEIRTVHGEKL